MLNLPIICFLVGILATFIGLGSTLPARINKFLTIYILFCVGLKGGGAVVEHVGSSAHLFLMIVTALVLWGLVQPLLSFYLLKSSTRVDRMTAAAIAASFGSVSVMTFITAVAFLDRQSVEYEGLMIAALAIMEIPAIISGVCIAKIFDKGKSETSSSLLKALKGSLLNKAIVSIFTGLLIGGVIYIQDLPALKTYFLFPFQPLLCLFLFDMGLKVGFNREHFRQFSWPLALFGLYMPLIGGGVGLLLSYFLHLDAGTGTLIAVLGASSSYIAVPAAMRMALPQAQEAIYLPLSLGIAFPFNVVIGIPLFYRLASHFLG